MSATTLLIFITVAVIAAEFSSAFRITMKTVIFDDDSGKPTKLKNEQEDFNFESPISDWFIRNKRESSRNLVPKLDNFDTSRNIDNKHEENIKKSRQTNNNQQGDGKQLKKREISETQSDIDENRQQTIESQVDDVPPEGRAILQEARADDIDSGGLGGLSNLIPSGLGNLPSMMQGAGGASPTMFLGTFQMMQMPMPSVADMAGAMQSLASGAQSIQGLTG